MDVVMNERKINELLYLLRIDKKVKQKKLCWGLCSQGTYCRYEYGERMPDSLLLNAIMQRMGKSTDKLTTILSIGEYRYYLWKRNALAAVSQEDMDELDRLLKEPIASKLTINKVLQKQFLYRMQALVAYYKDADISRGISLLEKAIDLTIPNMQYHSLDWFQISIDEMHIMLELANFRIKGNRSEESKTMLLQIVEYTEKNYDDYEAKVKVLPRAVKLLYPLLMEEEKYEEAMKLCKKAVDLLLWQGVLYDLAELLTGYLQSASLNPEIADTVKYERQLQALLEVYEEYGADLYLQEDTRLMYQDQELYLVDEMILRYRIRMGISQEELSEDICTPETISRIESCRRGPNPNNFIALMRKLGTEHDYYNGKLETNNYLLLEKMKEMERAMSLKNWEEAQKILDFLKPQVDMNFTQNKYSLYAAENCIQFFTGKMTPEEFVKRTEAVLGCENEGWRKDEFWELTFFTGSRITLLNHIAIGYEYMHQLEKSIFILEHLMKELENSKVCLEDRYESSMSVVGNLSGYYGEVGRLEECLEMCEKGIKLCFKCGRGVRLAAFLVNKAEAIDLINNAIVPENKKYLKQAHYLGDLMSDHTTTAYIDKYYRNNYESDIIWY